MTELLWPLCRMTLLTTLLWMAFVFLLLIDDGQSERMFVPAHNTCGPYIRKYEKHHAIPTGLLHAISKAESGIKDIKGRLVPWPWTINAQGKGYFFPNKQAAISAVRALQAKGIESIDVGCMQVNLYYHPKAFKSLADAFEPSKNVAYAARFITSLKKDHNCWHRAIAHYHSSNPIHHIPYHKMVLGIWKKDKKARGVLAAGIFSEPPSLPPETHIRRLGSGKRLKVMSGTLASASKTTYVSRRIGGHSSHVRRLKLSN